MYKSLVKRQESDREVQAMRNRLNKLRHDIERSEKHIKINTYKRDSFRKARELYNKDLQLRLSEKKRRMQALRQENQRIKSLYQFRWVWRNVKRLGFSELM